MKLGLPQRWSQFFFWPRAGANHGASRTFKLGGIPESTCSVSVVLLCKHASAFITHGANEGHLKCAAPDGSWDIQVVTKLLTTGTLRIELNDAWIEYFDRRYYIHITIVPQLL